MRYALDLVTAERIDATPSMSGTCPHCGARVIAKCGAIVTWHWAHIAADCDSWAEPDSSWHREWQGRFPEHMREVRWADHRADVLTPRGVVEIQHSNLSPAEIDERERVYGRMVWIWDATEAYAAGRIDLRRKDGRPDNWRSFRWKHARKSLAFCQYPTLIHLAPGKVLRLGRMFPKAPTGGWGWLITEDDAVASMTGRMTHG